MQPFAGRHVTRWRAKTAIELTIVIRKVLFGANTHVTATIYIALASSQLWRQGEWRFDILEAITDL